jgi:regulator of PEP synthase PpsR (kinase-PPPase family)
MDQEIQHIHLVSDATGETINAIARACLVQFEGIEIQEHYWSLVRTSRQLALVMEGIQHWPGLVLYTFVDEKLQRTMKEFCRKENVPSHAVLEPILTTMASFFGRPFSADPGRQHALDSTYFQRIDAMDFALAQDDGNKLDRLKEADVVVLGVSRTSKTPTCVYLAYRGIRAANIPIIPGIPLDLTLFQADGPLIVGLTKDVDSLIETRRTRLKFFQQEDGTHYTDPEKVREEVQEARRLYARLGCPVIDVTRRSIEETSAEIMMLLNKRRLDHDKKTEQPPEEAET